jgi:LmbE family N-acetylglucosaminyl deacetylase
MRGAGVRAEAAVALRLAEESDLVPYAPGFPPGRTWLVLAPHADDESLGIGATLALAADAGVEVRVVIVTDGAQQGETPRREAEAVAAAGELGVPPPTFWRLPDRGLGTAFGRLRRAVGDALAAWPADTLLVTSPVELHPDHRALALSTQRALRRRTILGMAPGRAPRWVAAYEVSAPLLPNLLVAADAGWERKRRAVQRYASQLAARPYDDVMEAMGGFRCLTLSGCRRAEAFHVLPAVSVARRSAASWAALMGSPAGVTRRPSRAANAKE